MELKNLIVQLYAPSTDRSEGRIGTAYPVAPKVLMSAAHVVGDADGDSIQARWWHQPDSGRQWKTCTKIIWDGRTQSPPSDVVLLSCDFPASVEQQWGQLAAVRPTDHAKWASEGFPFVGDEGKQAVPLKGTTHSMGDHSEHFHLAVDASAETEEGWEGASGGPVFVNDRIIGVIVTSPRNYNATRFEAVPVFRLLENSEFRSLVQYSEAEDQRLQLARAAVEELARSDEAMAYLSRQLKRPDLERKPDRHERASVIVEALLDEADPVKLAKRIVTCLRQITAGDDAHQRAVTCLNAVAMHLIPASLATGQVQQIRVIAESAARRYSFQAKTKTFVEFGMARLHGRPAQYRTPTSQKDEPSPVLCLEKPAEVGIDENGEQFKRDFVFGLRDAMAMPDFSDSEFPEVVDAINDELELRSDLGEGLHYYVFPLPVNDDQRQRYLGIIQELDDFFPRLTFIGLDANKASSDERRVENQSVSLVLRILCRAAGIEWRIDAQDDAT